MNRKNRTVLLLFVSVFELTFKGKSADKILWKYFLGGALNQFVVESFRED